MVTVIADGETKGYRKLVAWQKADQLASHMFLTLHGSRSVPRWLTDQTCRAAISVPANIAEGYSRGAIGDYVRSLEIASGSLAETEYYIGFLAQHRLISQETAESACALVVETGNVLHGLITSITAKRNAGTWARHVNIGEEEGLYREDPL